MRLVYKFIVCVSIFSFLGVGVTTASEYADPDVFAERWVQEIDRRAFHTRDLAARYMKLDNAVKSSILPQISQLTSQFKELCAEFAEFKKSYYAHSRRYDLIEKKISSIENLINETIPFLVDTLDDIRLALEDIHNKNAEQDERLNRLEKLLDILTKNDCCGCLYSSVPPKSFKPKLPPTPPTVFLSIEDKIRSEFRACQSHDALKKAKSRLKDYYGKGYHDFINQQFKMLESYHK